MAKGQQVVVPSTTVAPIDHIFTVYNDQGIAQPTVTIDGTHFIVTVEVWTGGSFAAGTETPVVTNKGAGKYRVTYAPLHPGSVYRTLITCKPDGSTEGIVDPPQFQETPLYTL
jgi:hypothetical protein